LGRSNFTVVALFDNDARKIGQKQGDAKISVHDAEKIGDVIRAESIDVMVIAVPAKVAQKVLNQIMSAGIKAVLNFAPVSLNSRRGVKVKTVDLTTSLESLSYFLARPSSGAITHPRPEQRDKEIRQTEKRGSSPTVKEG
jgi:redox-sensing transcriptional repressor